MCVFFVLFKSGNSHWWFNGANGSANLCPTWHTPQRKQEVSEMCFLLESRTVSSAGWYRPATENSRKEVGFLTYSNVACIVQFDSRRSFTLLKQLMERPLSTRRAKLIESEKTEFLCIWIFHPAYRSNPFRVTVELSSPVFTSPPRATYRDKHQFTLAFLPKIQYMPRLFSL